MKRFLVFAFIIILILLLFFLGYRSPQTKKEGEALFSGKLYDDLENPIAGAEVRVGEQKTLTDAKGKFIIKGSWASRDRWVLEVRRPGYAPISKVLDHGITNIKLTLAETTVKTFDAANIAVVRDNRTRCIGSPVAKADWDAYPTARFPHVFDANGKRITGELPVTARRAFDFMSGSRPCNTGFQVSIPANSLVDTSGRNIQGEVSMELSTVDLYSPDGMPGDYSVSFDQNPNFRVMSSMASTQPTYMESFGAGTVTARTGNKSFQLKKGAKAEIRIPVDPAQIRIGAKIPATIPLLRYEPKNGTWIPIGEAKLDEQEMTYVGEIEHLSEFNADVVKTNPACIRVDASGISGNFDLVTTAPTSSGGFKQFTHPITPNLAQANPNLHAIYNLPANEWVVLRALKAGVPVGTWVVETGAPWGSTSAPSYDYAACGTIFNLSASVGTGVTENGSGDRFGLLPKHVAFLVSISGSPEDVYPVGLGAGGGSCVTTSDCFYVFSLFDSGSKVVLIDGNLSSLLGIPWATGPGSSWDVDVRLNGFNSLSSTLTAPYGLPGTSSGAEAHSNVLRVAPRNETVAVNEPVASGSGFVPVYYILTGTPVANKVVAKIDYTTPVTKGSWNFGTAFNITAPDIRFYQPSDSGIPTPTLTLFLEGFGSTAANPNGTTDQRHFLQNVTFSKGGNSVYDSQTLTNPKRFMFDTGTTFTVISQAMAAALGANPASPDPTAGCSSNNQVNFVQLDSIEVVGMNNSKQLATYRINNAEVCVDVAGTVIKSTSTYPDPANPSVQRKVDAVIGANIFKKAKILWNGPRRTVSLLP
ncbi:MAG: aspartyl protease family protein [Gammaproteobacteria bacterium]